MMFLMKEISKSIELKSELISNSFSDTLNGIRKLEIRTSNGTDMIVEILNDIKKKIEERPTIVEIEQSAELNDYLNKQSELKSLEKSLNLYLEMLNEYSYNIFQENCKSVQMDKFLDYINNKLKETTTNIWPNSFQRSNILATLASISDNSIGKFKEFTTILLEDAEKAEYLSKLCLTLGKIQLEANELKFFINKSQEIIQVIQRRIIESEYFYINRLSKSISSTVQTLILTKLSTKIDNSNLANYIFNYLFANFYWHSWAVIVTNKPMSFEKLGQV